MYMEDIVMFARDFRIKMRQWNADSGQKQESSGNFFCLRSESFWDRSDVENIIVAA